MRLPAGIAHDDPTEGVPRYCLLFCPWCNAQHFDEGEWLERPHHEHRCATCGKLWRVEPFCFGVGDPVGHYDPTVHDLGATAQESPSDDPMTRQVMTTVTEAQLEKLGHLVDRIDNLVHAGDIPMLDATRVKSLAEALPDLHSELKTLYVEISGDDPWADI